MATSDALQLGANRTAHSLHPTVLASRVLDGQRDEPGRTAVSTPKGMALIRRITAGVLHGWYFAPALGQAVNSGPAATRKRCYR